MIWPKKFDYHVIKYDGQNLSIKYDRDPPHQNPPVWPKIQIQNPALPECPSPGK